MPQLPFPSAASLLAQASHRPFPYPAGPWLMTQRWSDLLFAHWPVAPEALRPLVPEAFELDLFDGRAWVGVVPFYMSNVKLRGFLPFGATQFPELNVRTYVRHRGDAGVYFFSLDATSWTAVRGARITYRLPYYDAAMSLERDGDAIEYRSRRTHRGAPPAEFNGRYQPTSEPFFAEKGSLEHWLTERYCLLTVGRRGRPLRGDIHHLPWPLQRAEADIRVQTMASAAGIALPDEKPHLLFAREIPVLIWPIRGVASA
jgi:uncharacterized protein YqjF (DUF2071 family)